MRTMALDVGDKTIGVAVTDELGWTAQGITTIIRENLVKDLDSLGSYLREYDVGVLVVGLPLVGDGKVGLQAEKVLSFVEKIKSYLDSEGLDIVVETWDESMTTSEAHEVLAAGNVTSKKRKKVVDKLAAVFILKSYMEGME